MILIDTNVFVYAVLPFDQRKRLRARDATSALQRGGRGAISGQVAAEFASAVSREVQDAGKRSWISEEARTLIEQWTVVPVDSAVAHAALALWERYSLSYWDAQILAAAVVGGCDTILTEDVPAPELAGVRYVNPFAEDFDLEALLG